MATKTLQERRRFLCGAGVVLGLPLLDGFMSEQAQAAGRTPAMAPNLDASGRRKPVR